jgi:hypothetical protein
MEKDYCKVLGLCHSVDSAKEQEVTNLTGATLRPMLLQKKKEKQGLKGKASPDFLMSGYQEAERT